ncbi:3-phosphoshikimate 1-carboxyvinyltransferase [Candidatus Kinetoplastidibacterium crithidiae]|uniref:3-phosphoshikimate 1-carboxyvinyltransferase n=1 Tax=Candidatus Kinetoplastidibacterium crithidiae TCC036E TaxID=1208918 RepID=M1LUD3_9PROT|nr:3-phosphoshikimate 1-carboxyvinyltransferase [Candidatus Kinetoplastibacterium crithidii (ex Angomonas deanei ATCC 30255)]AGF47711.1 3-phosphoshikimate 1-carboxyvinyltransferase [Candidatus Kinetoplastibacterium crithidii TCC036E]
MDQKMAYLDLGKYCKAEGGFILPGSKSISNRVLLLSALSNGVTEINGLLSSDDTKVMIDALSKLGIIIVDKDINNIELISNGSLNNGSFDLFLGNAGTALRPLLAVLSFMDGYYKLHGVPRMHERPIRDLVNALRQLGCNIKYYDKEGYPPLIVSPFIKSNTDSVSIKGSVSSQFLTALLLAAPVFTNKNKTNLTINLDGELISKPYIDITLNLMEKFGVVVNRISNDSFFINHEDFYTTPGKISVEGDASAASYFLALGAIAGGPIIINGVGNNSIQGDIEFTKFLTSIGANIKFSENSIESSGILVCNGEKLKSFDVDFNMIPDAAMTAAVLALYADGKCFLRNIGSWRVKETDRINAMQVELSKFGVKVESGDDWLSIDPIDIDNWPSHVSIDTWDDHRMAMCFSLTAFGKTNVRIMDPSCVNKTFPEYFDVYNKMLIQKI